MNTYNHLWQALWLFWLYFPGFIAPVSSQEVTPCISTSYNFSTTTVTSVTNFTETWSPTTLVQTIQPYGPGYTDTLVVTTTSWLLVEPTAEILSVSSVLEAALTSPPSPAFTATEILPTDPSNEQCITVIVGYIVTQLVLGFDYMSSACPDPGYTGPNTTSVLVPLSGCSSTTTTILTAHFHSNAPCEIGTTLAYPLTTATNPGTCTEVVTYTTGSGVAADTFSLISFGPPNTEVQPAIITAPKSPAVSASPTSSATQLVSTDTLSTTQSLATSQAAPQSTTTIPASTQPVLPPASQPSSTSTSTISITISTTIDITSTITLDTATSAGPAPQPSSQIPPQSAPLVPNPQSSPAPMSPVTPQFTSSATFSMSPLTSGLPTQPSVQSSNPPQPAITTSTVSTTQSMLVESSSTTVTISAPSATVSASNIVIPTTSPSVAESSSSEALTNTQSGQTTTESSIATDSVCAGQVTETVTVAASTVTAPGTTMYLTVSGGSVIGSATDSSDSATANLPTTASTINPPSASATVTPYRGAAGQTVPTLSWTMTMLGMLGAGLLWMR